MRSAQRMSCMSVAVIQVSPPGVFCTCFYNHACRFRLEKLLHIGPSRSSNGRSKPLLGPGGGFRSKTAVAQPFWKCNGYNFVTAICKGHSPTDTSARSCVAVVQRPWPLVKGNGFVLVSERSPGIVPVRLLRSRAPEGANFNDGH